MGDPNFEHKKTTFPYVEPTVQLPDEIEENQKRIDDDFSDLLSKIYGQNDVFAEQKKQKEIEDAIEDRIKEPITNNDDWWEEEIFSTTDTQPRIAASKNILNDIKQTTNNTLNKINIQALSNNILRNLRLIDNRTTQKFMDDYFISIDDRTQREREEDDNISLESEDEKVTIEDVLELDNIDNR